MSFDTSHLGSSGKIATPALASIFTKISPGSSGLGHNAPGR